jgi:spore maturation protein CgeB
MEDIPGIVRQSVISLNFANSPTGRQIKARNFEVPGFGGFLLAEYADGLERYYEIGRQIDTFLDLGECREKILHYLSRPEERDSMAWAAHRRTIREHTYAHRMEELLRFVTERVPIRRGEPPERILADFQKMAGRYHRFFPAMRIGAWVVTLPLAILKGRMRGSEIARWLCFQVSWRFLGERTYSCRSVPGRMFPHV